MYRPERRLAVWYRAGYFIGTTGGYGTVFYSNNVVAIRLVGSTPTPPLELHCSFRNLQLSLWFVRIGVFLEKNH
nr:MAG TPA: hypothetical protein [Caudoviricetes sp.]